jgi:outer membrane protein, heavy metal efflux system
MRVWCALPALVAVLLAPISKAAAQTSLTLDDVYAGAREQASSVVSARLALDEARGRVVGASVRFPSNPEIGLSLGTRRGESTTTDMEFGLTQQLEPRGRRNARVAVATAEFNQATATVEETTRLALRDAGHAYYRALYATERLQLFRAAENLAAQILQIADRRFRAGDIAALDLNIAKGALARVRADREDALATLTLALGDVQQLLSLEGEIRVEGQIASLPALDQRAALLSVASRPELRALEQSARQAEAEMQLGRSFQRPDYGLGVQYKREGFDNIALGGLTVNLPVFSNGQELRTVGSAKAARVRFELSAARTRIDIELRAALRTYEHRLEAVRVLQTDALPGLDDNEALASRSFDVGQLGLPDLLLIRREILDTRFQYLDALLEAAIARVDVDASAALLR